jgi:hypothetical protein
MILSIKYRIGELQAFSRNDNLEASQSKVKLLQSKANFLGI